MIKRKGNVYKLDTPATTLLIRAERCAEYLYYGAAAFRARAPITIFFPAPARETSRR